MTVLFNFKLYFSFLIFTMYAKVKVSEVLLSIQAFVSLKTLLYYSTILDGVIMIVMIRWVIFEKNCWFYLMTKGSFLFNEMDNWSVLHLLLDYIHFSLFTMDTWSCSYLILDLCQKTSTEPEQLIFQGLQKVWLTFVFIIFLFSWASGKILLWVWSERKGRREK